MARGRNQPREHSHTHGRHGHTPAHLHGAIDPSIFTTRRGIWAVKWSFLGLMVTAIFQIFIVFLTGSVALLADTIHKLATEVRHQLLHHLRYVSHATIHIDPATASGEHHHRIPEHTHDDLSVHSHEWG